MIDKNKVTIIEDWAEGNKLTFEFAHNTLFSEFIINEKAEYSDTNKDYYSKREFTFPDDEAKALYLMLKEKYDKE